MKPESQAFNRIQRRIRPERAPGTEPLLTPPPPSLDGTVPTLQVQLIGNPVIGRLCDTQGAKVALQMSQLATGVNYVLLGCAWNVPVLFASQLPNVLMQSMLCAQAFVTDFSSDESRSAALGRLSISYGLGMICGPLVGGFLSEVIGYHGVAFLAGGLMFIPLLINSYSLPSKRPGMEEKAEGKSKDKGLQLSEVFKVLTIPLCRNLTIFMLFTGLAAQIYSSTFSMAAPKFFNLSAKDLGMVQTTTALTGVLANTFAVGLIEKKLTQRAVITLASLTMACTFGIYTMATTLTHLLVLAFLGAWPSTATYTTVTSMLTRGTPREVPCCTPAAESSCAGLHRLEHRLAITRATNNGVGGRHPQPPSVKRRTFAAHFLQASQAKS